MVATIECISQTLLLRSSGRLFGSWKDYLFVRTNPRRNNSRRLPLNSKIKLLNIYKKSIQFREQFPGSWIISRCRRSSPRKQNLVFEGRVENKEQHF